MIDFQNFSGLTPVMKQYAMIKAEHVDTIILFQVGDFYELFFEDAKIVSNYLGITLTKRGQYKDKPIPLCGFPVHAVDHYVPKLIHGGFKLAFCDQMQTAVPGKMVDRKVTSVLTPGTLIAENLLDAKSNSYLFSFFPDKSGFGLLFSEVLSCQLHATILPYGQMRQLETELFRFLPDEVLLSSHKSMSQYETFFKQRSFYTSKQVIEHDIFEDQNKWIKNQFDENTVKIIEKETSLFNATLLWKKYLQKNQTKALDGFRSMHFYKPEAFLMLDSATQKNLDLVKNSFDGSRSHTLFSFMDRALTPMGSRVIKRWILEPLMDKNYIKKRQDVVQAFIENYNILHKIEQLLERFGDMERMVGRIALDKAQVQDYVNLGKILQKIPELQQLIETLSADMLQDLLSTLGNFYELDIFLKKSCNDDFTKNELIKTGFDDKLDQMRDFAKNSSQKILELEIEEQQRTGINSLKIRQNNLQGFYIEVTTTHIKNVPEDFIEQQALVGRKRFTTKKLQDFERVTMQSQEQLLKYEKEIFDQVKLKVFEYIHDLRVCARLLGILDALVGFAKLSVENSYVRPEFNDNRDIIIKDGRHPLVAKALESQFIANDTVLTDEQSLWIITGPNMGGKSTFLRQVALISLMAQTGSFVPAKSAQLSIIDRIFTRIGAGDFLAQGKSTFLIEMEETAQICLQATDRSLVILDEVGRGTSTQDGLALAQAVVEYLFTKVQARCLFATHYHELTHLESKYSGIVCFYADSIQSSSGIVFLHKMVQGSAPGSFGIAVAQLAQLPEDLIKRAREILLQSSQNGLKLTQEAIFETKTTFMPSQPDQGALKDKIFEKIKNIDFELLSPKQAFDLLWDLKSFL